MAGSNIYGDDGIYIDIPVDSFRKNGANRAGFYNSKKLDEVASIANTLGYSPTKAQAVALRETNAGEVTKNNPRGLPFVVNQDRLDNKQKTSTGETELGRVRNAGFQASEPARQSRYAIESTQNEAATKYADSMLGALNLDMLTPQQIDKLHNRYYNNSFQQTNALAEEVGRKEIYDNVLGQGIAVLKAKEEQADKVFGNQSTDAHRLTANQGFGKVNYGTSIVDNRKTLAYGKDVLLIEKALINAQKTRR